MQLPDYAIETLKIQAKRLDFAFSHIWGALSPSPKRDEIMWHIMTAKHRVNELIKENDNYGNQCND